MPHRDNLTASRDALSRTAHLICETYARMASVGLVSENSVAWPITQVELASTHLARGEWDAALPLLEEGVRIADANGHRMQAPLLAARILGTADPSFADAIEEYARTLEGQVEEKNRRLKDAL